MPFEEKYESFLIVLAGSNCWEIVLRDIEERGRDIEGCIKQWFQFVKPNFERYVQPQREIAGQYEL